MARERLPLQQELLSNLLVITRTREDVEHLLEHVTRLQSEAIAVAAAYGISQTDLADVSLLSRQRVGQLVNATEASRVDIGALIDQIQQVDDHPQDVMGAVSTEAILASDVDVRDALVDRQIEVVYGPEESARRAGFRRKARQDAEHDPERRAAAEERARRRARAIFGNREPAREALRPVLAVYSPEPPAACAGGVCGRCEECLSSGEQ